jgi:NADPH-dependent glutamate synthase beta subunit-like oxidoreductase
MLRRFTSGRKLYSQCRYTSNDIKACIVGSGPAGFYTAKQLFKHPQLSDKNVHITMLERLPTPYGLVRYGVAPDHPEVKNVIHDFEKLIQSNQDKFTFVGNVEFGKDVLWKDLHNHFDVIVLSYGVDSDAKLGIPGEDLIGVESAREFVNWYNGFPELAQETPSWFEKANAKYTELFNAKNICIIGQGNVALDVARILSKDLENLKQFDVPDHVLTLLAQLPSLKNIFVVGRRGPVQSACTTKELREMKNLLPRSKFYVNPKDLNLSPLEQEELEKIGRAQKRLLEIMRVCDTPDESLINVQLLFYLSPVEFIASSSDPTRLGAIRFEKTKLEKNGNNVQAKGTGEFETIPCELAFRSIGYKSENKDPDIPFDTRRGIIKNENGRVVGLPDTFVAGWIKRGPSGVIATSIHDAEETVNELVKDVKPSNKGGVQALLKQIKQPVVHYEHYKKIDVHEIEKGKPVGKLREKVLRVAEMLEIAHKL